MDKKEFGDLPIRQVFTKNQIDRMYKLANKYEMEKTATAKLLFNIALSKMED